MHVIEIFLPLEHNDGSPQPRALFAKVRGELIDQFGGLTAYTRAPAEGLWEPRSGKLKKDAIVVLEVMVEVPDRDWWSKFRERLERLFEQDSVLIRASAVELL